MGPEGVVLPAPAIGQALGFRHRGEQLGVEEFIPEPAVERLGKAVLPRCSWFDVGSAGALFWHHFLRAWAMNSGPLSDRMNLGAG